MQKHYTYDIEEFFWNFLLIPDFSLVHDAFLDIFCSIAKTLIVRTDR